ncbi:hypothetical protein Tco_0735864 [Tanacetum coccineum]
MVRPVFWQIRADNFLIRNLGLVYGNSYEKLFTLEIHHNGDFTNLPNRRYQFADINYVDLIDYDLFSLEEFVRMLAELGLGDDRIMWTHFRIPCQSLDKGLVPLMAVEDVIILLKYVTRIEEIEF